MQFEKILGQEHNIQRFLDSVQNQHIAHAQFIADAGNGSGFAFAWAVAQYLLCKNPSENDACGDCQPCRLTAQLQHPDLHFSFPLVRSQKNGDKNSFLSAWRKMVLANPYSNMDDWIREGEFQTKQSIIDIKEAASILKDLSLRPFMGSYKILVVWQPQKMNIAASNKLLKFIEEPQGKTLILFVGDSWEDILPTLQSRMQKTRLQPIADDEIARYLINEKNINPNLAEDISVVADGNISLAIRWLQDSEDLQLYSQLFVQWMRLSFQALQKKSLDKLVLWVSEMSKLGRGKQIKFLDFSAQYIRKSFLANYQMDQLSSFRLKDVQFDLSKFSPFIHAQNYQEIIEELELASKHIARNANAKIVFLDLAFKIARNLHRKLKIESNGM
ncbi:MAG: DNA polymerase III subunit delta' [Flavobacteriales bacterium]|jgi:DNA polymerase-3 subunit delta'|nr:DNA polymerase III subunit delta' [Flavobacteriales bacterium]